MNFVSTRQLIDDIRNWSARLPLDLVAVAGVPRSGMLPAALLAAQRNIPLVTLGDLRRGKQPWQSPVRCGAPANVTGRVLVVDDSVASGGTLRGIRAKFPQRHDLLFAAVYSVREGEPSADFCCRKVPHPRCFEWNVFHCFQMRRACLDVDGVLCESWQEIERDDGEGHRRYLHHLQHVRPRCIPSYPVLALVTSRLEQYRPQTERWLQRHGVRYGRLVMSPHATAAARKAAGDTARRKAEFYASLPAARLFVESDPRLSQQIFQSTGRPVLCTATMRMLARGDSRNGGQ